MTTNHPDPTPPPAEPAPSLRPVEELQALCDAATPGPWFVVESPFIEPGMVPFIVAGSPSPDGGRFVCDLDNMAGEAPGNPFADAAFIAAARTALPSLLARLRAAEETLAAVGALAEKWRAYQETGFYPEASAHANAIENCGDALADLLDDHAALAEGASR